MSECFDVKLTVSQGRGPTAPALLGPEADNLGVVSAAGNAGVATGAAPCARRQAASEWVPPIRSTRPDSTLFAPVDVKSVARRKQHELRRPTDNLLIDYRLFGRRCREYGASARAPTPLVPTGWGDSGAPRDKERTHLHHPLRQRVSPRLPPSRKADRSFETRFKASQFNESRAWSIACICLPIDNRAKGNCTRSARPWWANDCSTMSR